VQLVERLETLLPTDKALVWLLDEPSGALLPRASAALTPLLHDARAVQPVEGDRGRWGSVAFTETGEGLPTVENTHLRTLVQSMARARSLPGCYTLPIRADNGALLGVLDVYQRRQHAIPEHDRALLRRIGHFMGSAIQRKTFEEQERLAAEVFSQLASGSNDVWDQLSRRFESRLIQAALASTQGRRIEAAHRLGIGRNTITRKIHGLGLV